MSAKKRIEEIKRIINSAFENPLPGLNSQLKLSPPYREQVLPGKDKKDAAIVILIYPRNEIISTVFIKRNNYNGPHSGQISFPGGKFDDTDSSLEHTAIREINEEIGTKLTTRNLIGKLTPLYIPISKFYVSPYVAITDQEPVFEKNDYEVNYIIELPLKSLLYDRKTESMKITFENNEFAAPCFRFNNYQIWGATAMMLNEFLEFLQVEKNSLNSLL